MRSKIAILLLTIIPISKSRILISSISFKSKLFAIPLNDCDAIARFPLFFTEANRALFASVKNNGNLAIASQSLSGIANNFDLKEIEDIKILDLEIGIIVRSKIADYKITKFMIDLALKNIG